MGKKVDESAKNLLSIFPAVAAEWDIQRNSPLEPNQVASKSGKVVFWICPSGHSYQSKIINRANGKGCPYCSGHKVLAGFNDLATVNPKLAGEWDYPKNQPVTPMDISAGSSRKFFWNCESGHSFHATVSNRSNGRGCPFCSGRKASIGQTDLATLKPELAAEWDWPKNSPLTPSDVKPSTNKKVYWICPTGHSYSSMINSRNSGTGCPVCNNKMIVPGVNDLASIRPDLASEWDSKKNFPLAPSQVAVSSQKKVFWLCSQGHSFESLISNRSRLNRACPICAGQKVLPGFNDLATTKPELVEDWDYEANFPIKPEDVSSGTHKKIHWKCPNGHKYESSMANRSRLGRACPYCSGQKVLQGENDLATINPKLAGEWDFERNLPLMPNQVMAGSEQKAYWLCSENHSFRSNINSRNAGSGCPKCAKYGYDSTQTGLLYFIKNETLQARKIGITNANRKSDRIARFGPEWSVVKTFIHDDGELVRELETQLFRWIRKDLELPPYLGPEEMGSAGGHSETFSMEGPSDKVVLEKIEMILFQITNRSS